MRTYDRRDIEETLDDAAATINGAMREITAKYLEAAQAAETIKKIPDWGNLLPLLSSRTNLKVEDLVDLQEVWQAFHRHDQQAKDVGLAFDAMKAVTTSSEAVRRLALDKIAGGHKLDVEEVSKLEQRHRADSPAIRAEQDRADHLEALAWERVEALVGNLQHGVDELATCLNGFIDSFAGPDDEDSQYTSTDNDDYEKACATIRSSASDLLANIELLFGGAGKASISREAPKLDAARTSISTLANADFERFSRLDFDEILTNMEYLSSAGFDDYSPHVERLPSVGQRPRVLELCAGAGGTALGLMAAGFEHVCLVDKGKNQVATLRKNWPAWPVEQAGVESFKRETLEKFGAIDLLAAGLPCGPGEARTDADDLYPEMARIVGIVRPKIFILEHDAGQRQAADPATRGENLIALSSLEYKVREFELDPSHFGVPSSRRRYFVVGVRSDISGVFVVPKVQGGEDLARRNSAALSSLIAPYETPHNLQRMKDHARDQQQRLYDSWVKQWRADRARRLLPSTLAKEEKKQPKSWSLAGFLISEVVEHPPAVSDIISTSDIPNITFDILAAAQGFPRGWRFDAEKAGKLDMIQAALPPVVAKMVGLAVRMALTGEVIDLDKELHEPIVDITLIGTGPYRGRPLRKGPAYTQSELFRQAMRLLAGEPLGTVEPVRSRRERLKQLVADIQSAQANMALNPGRPRPSRFG